MLEYIHQRAVLFYVARCHADLNWYLSMTGLGTAANDTAVVPIRSHLPQRVETRLHILRSPPD